MAKTVTPNMLPIGVVIPTKNCFDLLHEHLQAMSEWLPMVQEVVVVDSFSTDGTLELLRAKLNHPKCQFFQHPPGLYASWNFGISKISAPYVYIATAGDTITSNGLQKLFETADQLKADVVLSKPEFCRSDGSPLPDLCWPIDEIIATLKIREPKLLTRMQALVAALSSGTSALTGSCASDLFRTEPLQRFPFPTDYGPAGDGAWGIQHAADLSWAIVPTRFSRFVRHASGSSSAERSTYLKAPRLDHVARQTVQSALDRGLFSSSEITSSRIHELLEHLSEFLDAKVRFDQKRREVLPWIISPGAWRARICRNRSNARLTALQAHAMKLAASI